MVLVITKSNLYSLNTVISGAYSCAMMYVTVRSVLITLTYPAVTVIILTFSTIGHGRNLGSGLCVSHPKQEVFRFFSVELVAY